MDLQLSNKCILVAGSSRGIGRAIAATLLSEGARVCLTGRNRADLAASANAFRAEFGGDAVTSVCCDFLQANAAETALDAVTMRWGGCDAVIANFGSGTGASGWCLQEAEWARLMQWNFGASVRLAQAAIPRLQARGGGSILFIASIAGRETLPAPLPYSCAKAAMLHYAKNLARQLAPTGIRVNCIAPGNILFPGGIWHHRLCEQEAATRAFIEAEVPQKRFGTPQEIAALAAFLASPQASFITGACVVADGGQTHGH